MSTTPLDTGKLNEFHKEIEGYQKLLIERVMTAYENKDIDYDEMKRLSGYISKRLSDIHNHDDFVAVLEYMTIHNPIFKQILVMETQADHEHQEKEMIEKLQSIISGFK